MSGKRDAILKPSEAQNSSWIKKSHWRRYGTIFCRSKKAVPSFRSSL